MFYNKDQIQSLAGPDTPNYSPNVGMYNYYAAAINLFSKKGGFRNDLNILL